MFSNIAFWSNTQDFRIAKRTEVLSELDKLTLSLSQDEIVQRAIDLVVKEFDLVLIGVYLVDLENQAVLQLATGKAGQILVQRKHKWSLSDYPTAVSEAINRVAICVTGSSPIMGIFYSPLAVPFNNFPSFQFIETMVGAPLLAETYSELVIPCLKAGKVIGAIEFDHRSGWERDNISLLIPVVEKLASFL